MESLLPQSFYATVLDNHDGNSFTANITLGLGFVREKATIRLADCKSPKLKQPGGPEAKQALAEYLPAGRVVLLESVKDDKYAGGYVATIWAIDQVGQKLPDGNIAQWLIKKGFLTA